MSCSAVLSLLAFLTRQLQVQDDPGYIARFKTATLTDLSARIAGMEALPVLQMSVALDPCYKKLKCLPKDQQDTVWDTVATASQNFYTVNQGEEQCHSQDVDSSNEAAEPQAKKKQKLTLLLVDSESEDGDDDTEVRDAALLDLARYKDEDQIP